MSASKKEKLEILGAAEDRAFAELIDTDPKEVTFYNILANIGQLRQVTEIVKFGDPNLFVDPDDEQKPVLTLVPPQEHKETEEEAHKIPEPDAEIPPQPKPVAETKAKPGGKTVSIDEVRKHLVALAKSGADLNGIFEPFGASKLSEVPEECFDDLLKLADSRAEGC